jgi:hypothetical protein
MLRVRADLALLTVTLIWGTTVCRGSNNSGHAAPRFWFRRFWVRDLFLLGEMLIWRWDFWIQQSPSGIGADGVRRNGRCARAWCGSAP